MGYTGKLEKLRQSNSEAKEGVDGAEVQRIDSDDEAKPAEEKANLKEKLAEITKENEGRKTRLQALSEALSEVNDRESALDKEEKQRKKEARKRKVEDKRKKEVDERKEKEKQAQEEERKKQEVQGQKRQGQQRKGKR